MRILHVVGARPNFMKAAPIVAEMARRRGAFRQSLVHTGQHYDDAMSAVFFRELDLPAPDVDLAVGSGSHTQQTAAMMQALEPVIARFQPDLVVVVGDVNSTLAGALVAARLGVRLAHVEAGLRSFDRSMPEETNRVLTDQVADLLFTTEESASRNLEREGVASGRVHFVGNVMIDSLVRALPLAAGSTVLRDLGLREGSYAVVTLHRPANVDDPARLGEILAGLAAVAERLPVVFPVHPRTRARIEPLAVRPASDRMRLIDPLGYRDFLRLLSRARLVLTDSGGVQEETTFLRVPCLTLRTTTERPVTIEFGTNRLTAADTQAIERAALEMMANPPNGRIPPLWDGHAAARIVSVIGSGR
jgi:UDP-N-acetylglucosamine 2-epimerase (non-hydrolysing)